jgi:hypothetical protein
MEFIKTWLNGLLEKEWYRSQAGENAVAEVTD